MRVLVTGARGQLGGDLLTALDSAGHEPTGTGSAQCDITSPAAIRAVLADVAPDVLVNCAAWTQVDRAEAVPDDVFGVNALGPRLLAGACHAAGVLLVQVSTDFVFAGDADRPIDEWAERRPLGVYGASKAAGEDEVRALCPRHQIVRTSWLYGRGGPNFVLTMLRLAGERDRLRVVADQRGAPTWTGHLAAAMVRLVERDIPGTYHLTNSGETTWHGLAVAVLAAAGRDGVPVDPIGTDDYPTPARRPAYSVLDNRAWRLLGEHPLPTWEAGVHAYVDQLRAAAALPGADAVI